MNVRTTALPETILFDVVGTLSSDVHRHGAATIIRACVGRPRVAPCGPSDTETIMRLLHQNRERTTHAPDCHVCTGSGRVPYVDNHFDLWMLPCPACRRG